MLSTMDYLQNIEEFINGEIDVASSFANLRDFQKDYIATSTAQIYRHREKTLRNVLKHVQVLIKYCKAKQEEE